MSTLVISIAIVALAVAVFVSRRPRGAKRTAVSKREAAFWSRPGSFSFIIFDGDVRDFIPTLLEACGYRLLESLSISGEFGELYESVSRPSGPRN